MIERPALVADLRREVTALEDDMRGHIDATPELAAQLRLEHQRAQTAHRTAMSLTEWRDGEITQAAVAWVIGCVFVRFLEDNELIEQPLLSGPGPRLDAARGQREVYFEQHPQKSDREYLLWAFDQVAQYPAVAPLYDPHHAPLRRIAPSVDGARRLRELWQRTDPDTGALAHDFSDPSRSTRFLGDLYQDLSDAAKKRYALLQTPEFVEEFILDRTLEPALDEFGLLGLRMIDPTCGSGHFLLGGFHQLLARWREREPLTNVRVLAQHALDQVYGVDLNPYATAIARFRLLVEAMIACEITRLPECPDFKLNLATGDSLLHGPEPGQFAGFGHYRTGIAHVYRTEDAPELARIFGQGYHVVVGNPPYIIGDDQALRDAYRERYRSCKGAFSLAVPFMERFFELAHPEVGERELAGYVGQITANSFMKREFGQKLVEDYLALLDLTTIIDTSGAYIPGHGTPTVIIFGRARPPLSFTLRVLDAVRGEPSQPPDPAHGLVWQSILDLVDQPGQQNRFIRTSDVERLEFATHPMTLGVGRELRKRLERTDQSVDSIADQMGFGAVTREDEVYDLPNGVAVRHSIPRQQITALVSGDEVRDWHIATLTGALWPYDITTLRAVGAFSMRRFLWQWRAGLSDRVAYGNTQLERGLEWYEYSMFFDTRYPRPTISWGEVATHNHFVLDRGGKVFKQTAPVIKLPAGATEEEHLRLLGVLNSSTACFWLMQVCHNKGAGGGKRVEAGYSALGAEFWESHFGFNATNVKDLPLPHSRPLALPQRLDELACERGALLDFLTDADDLHVTARELAARDADLFAQMISLQEELDWAILVAYGLVSGDLPRPGLDAPLIHLGERAFELVLARQMERGEVETTWFERHGSTPITEPPAHWPATYREIVEQRIELIERDPDVGLIERPEHKRRWSGVSPFEERLRERLEQLLLDRLEAEELWGLEPRLRSLSELADVVRRDQRLVAACELIAGSPDVDPGEVVAELVLRDAVPYLAALRHTDSGMRKRAEWERVWALQRREDAIDALALLPEEDPRQITAEQAEQRKRSEVGTIAVPPRYAKTDFRADTSWRLRGKLDVPKERFTLYAGAERGAGGATLGWAGWDELQKATALAARIVELQSEEAADQDRLAPLLAGVLELLPWIHQWHPEPDPRYGQPPGVFFESWLDGTLSALGLTRDELTGWRAPASQRGRRRRAAVSAR